MNNKSLLKHVLISLFFLSIVSCSNPGNKGNSNNNGDNNNVNAGNGTNNVNTGKGKNNVTVLCRCKKGFTSWSGPDQASAENRVRKNCSSIGGSVQDCKVIN